MHVDYIDPETNEKWPSATQLTNLLPKDWLWAWYKSSVKRYGWRGWQLNKAMSKRGMLIGTNVHNALQDLIAHGECSKDTKYNSHKLASALLNKVEPLISQWVDSECHLISKIGSIHGTCDAIVELKDQTNQVLDWKTSYDKSLEHPIQLAIYALAWNEQHPERQIYNGMIVRINKKSKKLNVIIDQYPMLQQYYPLIHSLRQLWEYQNKAGKWKEI